MPTPPRSTYRWMVVSKLGLTVWLLAICAECVAVLSLMRNFPEPHLVILLAFGILGVSFFGGLILLFTLHEASIDSGYLLLRQTSLLDKILKRSRTERRVSRESIRAISQENSLFKGVGITVSLDDGSTFRIQARAAKGDPKGEYGSFLVTLRQFAQQG